MKSSKPVRLYNVLFPIWAFWLWPSPLWLILLAGNFAIDSLVVCLAAGKGRRARVWKGSILRVWLLGYACDLVGAMVCLFSLFAADALIPAQAGMASLILFPGNVLVALPGVLVAGVLLYFCNRWWSFRRCGLDAAEIHRLSLVLALFTAPWTMLIPIYG